MANANADQARNGNGKFMRTIESVERDAKAARLRSERKTFQEIADLLGYCTKGDAWRGVQRAKAEVVREPVTRLIQAESEQLDELYAAALEVLEKDHVMVSHGRVVVGDDGLPLHDDGPRLTAIRELRAIRESYRKLHGLDAEKKVNVSGGVKYEVVGVSPDDLK